MPEWRWLLFCSGDITCTLEALASPNFSKETLAKRGFNPWVGKISPEEDMAMHSSILAWRISWTEESGGLWSIGPQRVGHDWSNLACTHASYLQFKCRDERGKEEGRAILLVLKKKSRNMLDYHSVVIFPFLVIDFISYFYIFYFSGATGRKGGKDMGLIQFGNRTQIVRARIQ